MLRLQIDGLWEPEDFIEVLKGVESFYYKAALPYTRPPFPYEPPFYWQDALLPARFEEHVDLTNDWLLARARATARDKYRMKVRRISYASPGGIDLVGLGQVCNAVKGVVANLVKLCADRYLRREADAQARIETHIEEESLRGMKIENARKILEIRRDFPDFPEDTFVALVGNDQDRLVKRIAEGKFVGAEIIGDDHKKDDGDA